MLKVECFCSGPLQTNAFVVWSEDCPKCVVFDCPQDSQALRDFIEHKGLQPEKLFLTHAHADHMAGLDAFCQRFSGTAVFQHPLESSWLTDSELNLSFWLGSPQTASVCCHLVEEGQKIEALGQTVEVFHTPGHSPGSVVFYWKQEQFAMVGDLIFRGGVGRWDLPGSDKAILSKSISKLMELCDQTRLYPGHGESTILGLEKVSNPYLPSLGGAPA